MSAPHINDFSIYVIIVPIIIRADGNVAKFWLYDAVSSAQQLSQAVCAIDIVLMSDTDTYNEQCFGDAEPHQWHCICSYQVSTHLAWFDS